MDAEFICYDRVIASQPCPKDLYDSTKDQNCKEKESGEEVGYKTVQK